MKFSKDNLPPLPGGYTGARDSVMSFFEVGAERAEAILQDMRKQGIIYYEKPSLINGNCGRFYYTKDFDWAKYEYDSYEKFRFVATGIYNVKGARTEFQCIVEWNKLDIKDLESIILKEIKKLNPRSSPKTIALHNLIEIGSPISKFNV